MSLLGSIIIGLLVCVVTQSTPLGVVVFIVLWMLG